MDTVRVDAVDSVHPRIQKSVRIREGQTKGKQKSERGESMFDFLKKDKKSDANLLER